MFFNWQYDDEQIKEATKDGVTPIDSMEECEIDWEQYQQDNELTEEEISFYYFKYIQLNRDIEKLHQEFPTTPTEAFIGTGSNFFSLKRIYDSIEKQDPSQWTRYDFKVTDDGVELYREAQGDIHIKEEALPGKNYVLGGDIAQGLENGDYTAFTIVGLDKDIKCFYKGHIEPDQASLLARCLGRRYNNALIAIESNFDGNWTNTDIVNNNYPNVYMRTSFDDITKTVTRSYGWSTNISTRKHMLDNMRVWFNQQTQVNCPELLKEMLTFVRNKRGKPMAMGDNHDDLCVATAVALVVVGTNKDIKRETKPKTIMDFVYG